MRLLLLLTLTACSSAPLPLPPSPALERVCGPNGSSATLTVPGGVVEATLEVPHQVLEQTFRFGLGAFPNQAQPVLVQWCPRWAKAEFRRTWDGPLESRRWEFP